MAFTINRRLSTLVDSNGQLNTGKIPNDYIDINHIADNSITTAMLHTGFTLPISSLTSIDTDDITEGSTNLFYTDARVDSHLSGGTGVTYSSGEISIGQAVSTSDSPTFADLTVTGNLNITGDINSYNVTDLDITDQTITLGAGQIEANSGGSGIIIDGASASILWDETNDQFDFNKGINIDSNTLVVDGTNNRVGILQASPAVSLDIGSATDALFVPKGTTAERPTGVDGYFRYNTDDAQFEGYADGAWGAIAGSGGAAAMETDNFTGDGSTTDFTLTSSVSDEDNLLVFIEGVYQNKADYVASGTTLTFDVAPVNGRNIVAYHVRSNISGSNVILTSLTGDGSTVAFTLTAAPGNENNTQVFMDGVYQQKDSYVTSGTTLTFDAAPENGTTIEVISYTQTTINEPTDGSVTTAKVANEAITSAKIDSTSTGIAFADLTVDTDTLVVDATNDRVGIGIDSPAYKLDLSGDMRFTTNSTLFWADTNVYDGRTGNDRYWVTGATERMRIDSSGNVGIGNTSPSPLYWPNGSTGGLFLQAGALLSAYNAGTNLSQNWYYNAGEKFIGNGGASRYVQSGQEHIWSHSTAVNSSGAGAGLTWSESMRIDDEGYVGIGTSFPTSQLDVRGVFHVGASANTTPVIGRSLAPSGSQGLFLTAGLVSGESTTTPTFADNSSSGASIYLGGNAVDQYGGSVVLKAYGAGADGNLIVFENRSGTNTFKETMRIDSAGYITTPAQPYIRCAGNFAGMAANQGTSADFSNWANQVQRGITRSGAIFTVPKAGEYLITYSFYNWINNSGPGITHAINLKKNNSSVQETVAEYDFENDAYSYYDNQLQNSFILNMAAGDTFRFTTNADIYGGGVHTNMSAYLLG